MSALHAYCHGYSAARGITGFVMMPFCITQAHGDAWLSGFFDAWDDRVVRPLPVIEFEVTEVMERAR